MPNKHNDCLVLKCTHCEEVTRFTLRSFAEKFSNNHLILDSGTLLTRTECSGCSKRIPSCPRLHYVSLMPDMMTAESLKLCLKEL